MNFIPTTMPGGLPILSEISGLLVAMADPIRIVGAGVETCMAHYE